MTAGFFQPYQRCTYAGRECFVRRRSNDHMTIMTRDGLWAKAQGGWEQVDKFEWEKTVSTKDIVILDEEDS